MPTNFLWGTLQSGISLLTTELNTLATGSGSAAGPAVDNTIANSRGWKRGRFGLFIASNSLAFTATSYVQIHLLPEDGAGNYPTYTSGASYKLAVPNYFITNIAVNPATQAANVVREYTDYMPLPIGSWKAVLVSSLGVTLPSSGNILTVYPSPDQY